MVTFLVTIGSFWSRPDEQNHKNIRKNWRRRQDLNRGWRFCRPKQAHPNRPETATSLAFWPPLTARIRLKQPQKGSATGSAIDLLGGRLEVKVAHDYPVGPAS